MKKEKTKSPGRGILPLLLCLCLVLSMLPGMGTRAFAAEEGKAVRDGTAALSENVNTTEAQVVYYGGRPYYVIGYGTSGVQTTDSTDTTATLLAKPNFDQTSFSSENSNQYSGSLLQAKVDGIAAALTEEERAGIIQRTLAVEQFCWDDSDGVAGTAVENAYLWPLSPREAKEVEKLLRVVYFLDQGVTIYYWWLRSPGLYDDRAARVGGAGDVFSSGEIVDEVYGVRPAFHLDLNSVSSHLPQQAASRTDSSNPLTLTTATSGSLPSRTAVGIGSQ